MSDILVEGNIDLSMDALLAKNANDAKQIADNVNDAVSQLDETYYSREALKNALSFTEEGGLEIRADGEDGHFYSVNIASGGIAFKYDGVASAYIDGNKLVIPLSVMLDEMIVGDPSGANPNKKPWSWRIRENGNLQLKWIGQGGNE